MTERRSPVLPALAGAGLLAVAALAWWFTGRNADTMPDSTAAATAQRRPVPVIFYLIDTLRADRLGLYGYDKPTSPIIDALAKESVVFDRAHSAAPWTLPSVSSLFTSRFPCEHGVIRNQLRLSESLPTLAERLQAAGYATGSYYQNNFVGPMAGLSRGFQVVEFRQDLETLDLDAREFLGRVADQPYFLYLHSMEPHATYFAPRDLVKKFGYVSIDDHEAFRAHWIGYRMMWFADAKASRPVGSTDTTEGVDLAINNINALEASAHILYDAAVNFADIELGQTIEVLRQTGAWDEAIFVLLADHGEEMRDHGLWFHDQSVYEEMTHVPLMIHFPGGRHGGKRVSENVSLLDVMPTVLDFVGEGDACENCRGSSLLPLVDAAYGGTYRPSELPTMRWNVWGYYKPLKASRGDINVVVRDGDLKGIWNKEPGTVELYDLASDPGEQQDLGPSDGTRATAMADKAAQWLAQCEATKVAPTEVAPEDISSEDRDRLRAHGYFGG
ncbi:MAG: sulfatase [Gammaproteobacteria bacterium]|nr:sulfatase [Gammaproteobacteria bacterium]